MKRLNQFIAYRADDDDLNALIKLADALQTDRSAVLRYLVRLASEQPSIVGLKEGSHA